MREEYSVFLNNFIYAGVVTIGAQMIISRIAENVGRYFEGHITSKQASLRQPLESKILE